MRHVVSKYWSFDGAILEYVNKEAFEAMVAEVPEFAVDLITKMGKRPVGSCRGRK